MGIVPVELLNNSQKMLSLVSQRQQLLADNIINMHTQGYRRKDIDFSQYLNSGVSSSLEERLVEKFGMSPISSNSKAQEAISPEQEFALMQENYMLYNVAVRNLSSTITQIKTALNVTSNG